MRQFRNLPIFVNFSAIKDSVILPRVGQVLPRWGVFSPPETPDAISGSFRATEGTLYEESVIRVLDEVTKRSVGRLLISLLPTRFPCLIRKMTEKDIKRLGECNSETKRTEEWLFNGQMIRGYVEIAFTPNESFSCVGRGPGSQPHMIMLHELTHVYEDATHGELTTFKITGDMGKYYDNTAEFVTVLVTNMYISETSSDLRSHHTGFARLPSEYSTSAGFLKMDGIGKLFEHFTTYDRRLANMLALLPEPKFNPVKEYLKNPDVYESDLLPTETLTP